MYSFTTAKLNQTIPIQTNYFQSTTATTNPNEVEINVMAHHNRLHLVCTFVKFVGTACSTYQLVDLKNVH